MEQALPESFMQNKFTKENPAAGNGGLQNRKFTPKYSNNLMQNQSNINFDRVKQETMPHVLALLNRILPGGKIQRHEYIALNPRRYDRKPGSFKFNTRTGRWQDWATGDSGGDLISLWAYVRNIKQIEAAREMLAIVGGAS